MKRVVKSRLFWEAVIVWLAFVPLAIILPRDVLFGLVNALSFSISIGVIVAYAPGVLRSIRYPEELAAGNLLVLGISCTWAATAARHMWNAGWRYFGRPDWMLDSSASAFFTWMLITGGLLHLAAQGSIKGQVPRAGWLRMGRWVAIGLMIFILMTTFVTQFADVTPMGEQSIIKPS